MGHWYTTDGEAMHRMVGANGKERDTTLRDARKLNLLPSVTTVVKDTLPAPGLEAWKIRQVLELAYENLPPADVFPDQWARDILALAEKRGEDRMGFGTLVHDALEKMICGKPLDILDVTTPSGETRTIYEFVNPVLELIADNKWEIHETEVVKVGKGYAGTVDAVYTAEDEYGILDFKTTKDATKPFIPPSYPVQIALYHVAEYGGIGDSAAGYNIFISTERNIGAVKAVRYDADALREAYEFGMGLVGIWQHLNNYTPEQ